MAFWQKHRNLKRPGDSPIPHGSLIMSPEQRETMEGHRNPQAEAAGSTLLIGGPGSGRTWRNGQADGGGRPHAPEHYNTERMCK